MPIAIMHNVVIAYIADTAHKDTTFSQSNHRFWYYHSGHITVVNGVHMMHINLHHTIYSFTFMLTGGAPPP
jgi:hypothetical protein